MQRNNKISQKTSRKMTSTDAKTKANHTVSNTVREIAEPDLAGLSEKTLSESDSQTEAAVEDGQPKANRNVLLQQLVSAKRVFSDRLLKSFHGDRSDDRATRLYHVWPGNNVQLNHAHSSLKNGSY